MAITDAAKRERAWFRRQKGYIREEFARDNLRMNKRVTLLERLLRLPSAASELEWGTKAPESGLNPRESVLHAHEGDGTECAACSQLAEQRPDLTQQTLRQIHYLHN